MHVNALTCAYVTRKLVERRLQELQELFSLNCISVKVLMLLKSAKIWKMLRSRQQRKWLKSKGLENVIHKLPLCISIYHLFVLMSSIGREYRRSVCEMTRTLHDNTDKLYIWYTLFSHQSYVCINFHNSMCGFDKYISCRNIYITNKRTICK